MLQDMTSGQFQSLLDQPVDLRVENVSIPVTVFNVTENARAQCDTAGRVPFSVVLRGPERPAFLGSATVDLQAEGLAVPGVFANRIVPLKQDGAAYYEIVFT